jgi:hypothetical protein
MRKVIIAGIVRASQQITLKGNRLVFPSGEVSSLPTKYDEFLVVGNKRGEEVAIQKQKKYIYLDFNKYDETVPDEKSLVEYLNKNGYIYFIGVDDR